ncbi:MAG: histidinol dehydrogenase [Lachnospiraceae bacterium]|nr:histidinol dehydrogenase [Lachnospiraceae bacterium]
MKIIHVNAKTRAEVLDCLQKRSPNHDERTEQIVREILDTVKEKGDEALFACTKRFDGWDITAERCRVTQEEIDEAVQKTDPAFMRVLEKACENITDYHEKQKRSGWFHTRPDGVLLGQRVTPLASAGVYVPGGKAAYPSSTLMNVVPAKVAGVNRIVMVTPAGKDGRVNAGTLAAAKTAGVSEIYKVGGAQAVAALAYGTHTIPKVDKIVGPGNIYVATAKKLVFGQVAIDSIAGPSEILILADERANPRYAAADLLSQAEHDERASAILITTSEAFARAVEREIDGFLSVLPRKEILERSLEDYGFLLVVSDEEEAVSLADDIASEHVEIMTANPMETMAKLQNAGAIFLGDYSSEPLGDYFAGPNHVLPTNGTARFFSPLSVDDFIKKSSVIFYGKEALRAVHTGIELFAETECLSAHANSIRVRFEEEDRKGREA